METKEEFMTENEIPTHIGVCNYADDSILKLDLSILNLKIYKIDSLEFKKYISGILDKEYENSFYKHYQYNLRGGFKQHLYAFCPININQGVDINVFQFLQDLLLVMFPSDFYLFAIVFIYKSQTTKGKYFESHARGPFENVEHSYYFSGNKKTYPDLLSIDDSEIGHINDVLPNYFKRIRSLTQEYSMPFSWYLIGFKQTPLMAYISYCIAFESLIGRVDDNSSITTTLCEFCKNILSTVKGERQVINHNVVQFYELRSRIVHGDNFTLLAKYFFPLRSMLSRILLEIIALDICKISDLRNGLKEKQWRKEKPKLLGSYIIPKLNSKVREEAFTKIDEYPKA